MEKYTDSVFSIKLKNSLWSMSDILSATQSLSSSRYFEIPFCNSRNQNINDINCTYDSTGLVERLNENIRKYTNCQPYLSHYKCHTYKMLPEIHIVGDHQIVETLPFAVFSQHNFYNFLGMFSLEYLYYLY